MLNHEQQADSDSSPVRTPIRSTELEIGPGCEWIVDADGCDDVRLTDLRLLQTLCVEIVSDLGLTVIGEPQWHRFPGPGGITGLTLLSESHLAVHTYPEFGLLTLNLYCCRPRPEWDWTSELTIRFGAERVCVRRVERGPEGDS